MKAFRSDLRATGVTTMSKEAIAASGYHGRAARRCGTTSWPSGSQPVPSAFRARNSTSSRQPAASRARCRTRVIARAAVLAVGRRRGRSDADHRDRPPRAHDPCDFAAVIVAVQDELAADAADHRLERGGVGQALEAALGGERRMVDHHDAAQALRGRGRPAASRPWRSAPRPSVPVARKAARARRWSGRPAPPGRAGAASGRC